jgi:hypothetical protein
MARSQKVLGAAGQLSAADIEGEYITFADSRGVKKWDSPKEKPRPIPAGQLFKRLDARDGVAVFHTRDVTALQAGALLNITLRKVFLLPNGAQAICDDHSVLTYTATRIRLYPFEFCLGGRGLASVGKRFSTE